MHNILEAMSEVPIVKQTGGPRRFLTILGESRRLMEQIRSGPRGRNEQLALSTGLYCVTIRYRGRAYVARVATTPSLRETEASPWVEEVFVPLHPDSDFLILYHDEMGVLKIEFFRDEDEVTVDDTYPSYQVLPLGKPANDTLLQFIYNVSFPPCSMSIFSQQCSAISFYLLTTASCRICFSAWWSAARLVSRAWPYVHIHLA